METCRSGQDSLTDDRRAANGRKTAEGGTLEMRVEDFACGAIEHGTAPRVRAVDIQAFSGLAEQSMRPSLRVVFGGGSTVSMRVAELCSEDLEQPCHGEKLGCPRGFFWALFFQAVAVVTVLVCWGLHILLR
jgi:hypothetical protein